MTPACERPQLHLAKRSDGAWVLRCTNCGLVMATLKTPNRWRALRPGTRFCLTILAISVAAVVGIVLAVASGWPA